ncbi:MAG TPA: hypothetical protein VKP78_02055 [bacterium]|nr:hypothetical protein [bacterium]
MRKIMFLILGIALFMSCSQKIGVGLREDFSPEIKVETGQDFPELQAEKIITKLKIEDKTFPIETSDGETTVKIPRKYKKYLKEGKGQPVDSDQWQISYDQEANKLHILPKTKTIEIQCQKQNPENFAKYIDFEQQDFDSLEVVFQNNTLPESRLQTTVGSDTTGPSILELQVPIWESIQESDYKIKIMRPFYEEYIQTLTAIPNNQLKLGLSRSELKVRLINKENSVFMPDQIYVENATGQQETFLTTEIEGGISLYDLEFPVKVSASQYKWQLFNYKDEKIDFQVYNKPGQYQLYYLEKERELPIVLYDVSRDQIDRNSFENWVVNKMQKIDNIFLYITNGYENVFNTDNTDYNTVINRIYRMRPQTSNILESIERFTLTLKRKDILENYLNNPVEYGQKLQPHYYLFISGDNVERLSTAINHFTEKLNRVDIPADRLTIYVDQEYSGSDFINSLKDRKFEIKTL